MKRVLAAAAILVILVLSLPFLILQSLSGAAENTLLTWADDGIERLLVWAEL